MKTTIRFIFTLLFLLSGSIHAQVRLLSFSSPPEDTLDYSKIRCIYEQQVLSDTSKTRKYTKDLMILQIGPKVSKYISYLTFCTDSLTADDIKKKNNIDIVEAVQSKRYQMGKDGIRLYKNFPEHKNTIKNSIGYDHYIYEEDIAVPEWKIEKETVTVAGYSCIKATARFCGRNYTAWFTPDIPVSEGPWKFTGLPGLILRAYDDKGEVNFECTQIEKVGWPDPILKTPPSRSHIKITRDDFYKQLKKHCDNPSGFTGNNTRVTSTAPKKIRPKIMYNPIELSE